MTPPPQPDPRWQNFIGGLTEGGLIRPMSFEVLEELADDWAELVPAELSGTGTAALLRTSRSLFAHSWFDYEFMVVACLVAFQAMEAAFRDLYPEAPSRPLMALVRQARKDGILPANIADLGEAGVELRNWLSHPATAAAFTIGMAGPMPENTHRIAVLVALAVDEERSTQGSL